MVTEVYNRTKSINDKPFIYCPGCSHGIIHRLLAEVIDEMNLSKQAVGICSIGCSVRIWNFLDFDWVQGAHGRAMAVGTGIKRSNPDKIVFTYQGDGDLAAIGMLETFHAALRGENITVIFVNNGFFGATGGQLAPTTLVGQKTSTTLDGRDIKTQGTPVKMAELFASLDSTSYIARVAVNKPANVIKAKKAITKAFQAQERGSGFSMVEIMASCPSNLKLNPVQSLKWVEENSLKYYQLGEFKKEEEDNG